MDLGALELQIFVSLTLVLGVVFVALLTDFLKGNNEALRERNIELVVRQEERARAKAELDTMRAQPQAAARTEPAAAMAPPPVVAAVSLVATPTAPFVEVEAPPLAMEPEPEQWATEEELAEVDEMAARIRESAAPVAPSGAGLEPAAAELFAAAATENEGAEPEQQTRAESPELEGCRIEETAGIEDSSEDASEEDIRPWEEPGAEAIRSEETAASIVAPGQPEREHPKPAAGLPRLTIHAKVTPIDVIAAERVAATEALHLARELQRVAEMTQSAHLLDGSEQAPGEEAEPAAESVSENLVETAEEACEVSGEEPSAAAVEESINQDGGESQPEELIAEESPEEMGAVETPEGESEPELEPEPGALSKTVAMPARYSPQVEQMSIPTGFQDFALLAEAMNGRALFRGTAVAISVSGMSRERGDAAGVAGFLESLLTPADFACQTSEDEFLLILPEETGAPAQRRLQYISQRLWDYQIRSVGARSLMFSWGAAEISEEPLRDAISAAKDRMWQTRRNRERHSAEIHHYRLRVAND